MDIERKIIKSWRRSEDNRV